MEATFCTVFYFEEASALLLEVFGCCLVIDFSVQSNKLPSQLGFSYFEFKIRLIRLGFSFQKQKFLYLTNLMILIHNHYTKEPTVSERQRKAFSSLHSCLTDSS